MKSKLLDSHYGLGSRNRLIEAENPSYEGAIAALETFYNAFNQKNISVLEQIWYPDHLVQLNNPLGGMRLGIPSILEIYKNIFEGKSTVWVEFADIISYAAETFVVFAGQETGAFTEGETSLTLKIRTTRNFVYSSNGRRWYQFHHHGSIDNTLLLKEYQRAVQGS